MEDIAIRVKEISKIYRLYQKPIDRVKDALGNLSPKKLYTEHHALDDISFDIHKGECIGIIGTNGAGKSTLLKIITGVLNQTSGDVEVHGRISALLELGAGFNMEYSGIDNIFLNGRMNGFSRKEIEKRLDDIIKFADIGDFINQPVKTYSSGMFVRLAFAVAINIDPEILIIDEALSVGDIFFQAKCFRKIDEFKNKGKTILFVSHSMASIQKYCDRAILLNKGNILLDGEPKEAIDLFGKISVMGNQQCVDDSEDIEIMEKIDNQELKAVETAIWKEQMTLNPKVIEYGSNYAEIMDFCIKNQNGVITNNINKGETFSIKMKVRFFESIENPIFAFTIKDIQGTELTGSNTILGENGMKMVAYAEKGSIYTVEFKQKMRLRCNDYLLALGCTGYKDGEFKVYHRLYDVCHITSLSQEDIVGLFDMSTKIEVVKEE